MSFMDDEDNMAGGLDAYDGLVGGSDAPMLDATAMPSENTVTNKAGRNNDEEGEEEEEEGEEVQQGKRISDDSSEEEEEDEEAERKVREGFIVDEEEEEEEEEEDDAEERRRRKRRRKHKHRKHKHRRDEEDEDGDLDEDDLELLEENTGGRVGRRLTRLRRGRIGSGGEEGESSDEGIDERNIIGVGAREIHDIQDIWNDDRGAGARDDDDEMDMDDFIDDEEDEEEGAGAMAEEEREERRRERRRQEKERRKMLKGRPELAGIDAAAWDEIIDVFGDGHDYDWALAADDDQEIADEAEKKLDMKYRDVFEPTEIAARFLTEDDDLIRAQDVPERMQLAVSTLAGSVSLSFQEPLSDLEVQDAASWVTPRLGGIKEQDFFKSDGRYHHLLSKLVEAVTKVLDYLFIKRLEVPFIYAHRRDYITYYDPNEPRSSRVELLGRSDLWQIYTLGQKYRSLRQRQDALQRTYKNLSVQDEYYEQHLAPNVDSVEVVTDVTQWLSLKYKDQKKTANEFNFSFNDDHEEEDQQGEGKKMKLPSRVSAYELAKKSIVSKLADGFGIKPHEVVVNFMSHSGRSIHFVEDQDVPPMAYAEQFADPDPSKALPPEELLRQARLIISTQLGADPLLRRHVRDLYKNFAQVSVIPTERGKSKIDEYHTYYSFKYLQNKPITKMLHETQFLHILRAEEALLVNVSITLPKEIRQTFVNQLLESFSSDSFSETAKAWNEERAQVIEEVVDKYLFSAGNRWVREYVRDEAEEYLAKTCGDALYDKINVAPYRPPQLEDTEIPSVLAVSHGKGDPKRDEISLVFMDEGGRVRENFEIDNLDDQKCLEKLADLMRRRKPDVLVVGGLSINTAKLMNDLKKRFQELSLGNLPAVHDVAWADGGSSDAVFTVPVIYVQDEVARLAQHSARLQAEFQAYSTTARYCIGLARYAQHPLNEYAALGGDLTAITFDEVAQPLVPTQKLLTALERALVDVTNSVGVDINRAVNERYYASLLPFIAGLGPRKAQALLSKIAQIGGTLVNREHFIKQSVLTTNIFMNAAGFLRISQDPDFRAPKSREVDYSNLPDPLDDTRIHPEDYDLARKMATDALELDEEDVHDENPSMVVTQIMKDYDKVKKLEELNLDEFAINMYETNGELKRHTLNVIRGELIRPFGDLRPRFALPEPWDILTMLTGETRRTLRVGLIVSVQVVKVRNTHVAVKLDSGIEGIINAPYLTDAPDAVDCNDVVKRGHTLPGVIIDVKLDPEQGQYLVELSSRPSDVAAGDSQFRRVKTDEHYDHAQAERDEDIIKRKKRAEVDRSRRVINHPLFKDFNTGQAESYLENQQPGDVVVRPSSKGMDHIAVTWKVANGLFQHIDVVEKNPDPSGQGLGGTLVVDGKYEFADLDELIVNHVKAMSRRVDELMAHEKFKRDDDELQRFLMSFVAANPNRSMYGFSLNRKRPGHFNLSFLAKKGSSIQTWPVRVAPEAYYLFDAAAAGVSELCDAFKVRYLHESQNPGGGAAGGKTPYGAGRMTPARTPARPGYATPGHMSVRQAARTPNPYQPGAPPGVTPQPPSTYGGATTYGATPNYGYQTPRPGAMPPPPVPPVGAPFGAPPQPAPMGMNPARAAMIQNMGGWGSGGGSGWR